MKEQEKMEGSGREPRKTERGDELVRKKTEGRREVMRVCISDSKLRTGIVNSHAWDRMRRVRP
jgi:hypothetical protein